MSTVLSFQPESIFVIGQKLWWFLIVLGVLVTFHEFGHFIVARWAGVRVLKFSIGFGPKLLGRQFGETEFVVSAIPLGGYVKMFGEDTNETISPEDQERSFVHKPLLKRTLIVAAGPAFNFILSYMIFTAWLATGGPLFVPTFQDIMPTVEAIQLNSPAHIAGMQVGDRITRINEKGITTMGEVYDAMAESQGKQVTIDVLRNGEIKTFLVTPKVTQEPDSNEPAYLLGIEEIPPVATTVMNDSPAMRAGMQDGDRIVQIENEPISTWSQMTDIVRQHPNEQLTIHVIREGKPVALSVTPEAHQQMEHGVTKEIGKIGIMRQNHSVMRASSPLLTPILGLQATWGFSELTVVGLTKMISGEISPKNIGGPIMIASASGEAAEQGLSNIAFLVAIISINLGILNLLPIPILDGGHLLFFAFEAILRRPLGERQREFAQQIGFVLLLCIMVFALWNDIERLLQ